MKRITVVLLILWFAFSVVTGGIAAEKKGPGQKDQPRPATHVKSQKGKAINQK